MTLMRRAVRSAVAIALFVGIGSAAVRVYTLANPHLPFVAELQRNQLRMLSADASLVAHWIEEVGSMEERFLEFRGSMFTHAIGGGLFLLFAPLQFSSRFRARHLRAHRWIGRVLVAVAMPSVLAATIFGALRPHGGVVEASANVTFGIYFLSSMTLAVVAIRRRDVASHRAWMIRAFSIGGAAGVLRIVGPLIFLVWQVPFADSMGPLFWLCWLSCALSAELWIRYTGVHGRLQAWQTT